ncbi:hypothetical protein GCM10009789_06160 [Kribbella sancticallisti]|uniref:Aminoglycoside phosphotransferase domain-containing protein n=1 Tax=Kribbella sancticallisti TaxID=460087 RepID=A0ABP4N4I8_9ACTN
MDVLRALGWRIEIERALDGSASGAGVYRVRANGRDAVLKVGVGRRELDFYLTLAERVPVATPKLLRYGEVDEFTALLLSAHTPAAPAGEWKRADWLEVTRQLAALHSAAVPEGEAWRHESWLLQALEEPPVGLAEDYWSRTEAGSRLGAVFEDSAALAAAYSKPPDCFVHGDCHVDNLLREGDQFVWADWQAATVGSPAGDLAFLWSRADADGADLPYDEMLHEYAVLRSVDSAVLRRAVLAAELGILLYGWPNYARHRSRADQARMTRRLLRLMDDWLLGGPVEGAAGGWGERS